AEPTLTGTVPTGATTGVPAPATTDPTATGILLAITDTPAPATTDPTATATLPTPTDTPAPATAPADPTTTDPTASASLPSASTEAVTTADAAAPLPTLGSPVETSPIATSAASDRGADPAPHQTSLGAASELALDASSDDVDAKIDAKIESVAGVDSADGPDTTTPPVIVNPASSLRRDDAPARVAGAPAALITDAADDLAPPIRLAPPRTIAVDLNDEGLGPLRVVATTEQRTVHLTVSAGEAIVRDALVRQQADLRHDLADAGLQLGSFDVDARAADRDHTGQPAATSDGDRGRPTARSAAGRASATPIHDAHEADGHLDLRL
ncbi:MAG TPA: flagellar hook-length control protein FliK, partial [Ilumatobacteraceae bacterium]|nr:flagellar hook-length control protein FliK [Ilumatobacteraceae bacterium]